MPELGEVAHAASILRRFIANKTIKAITTTPDSIVYVSPLTNTSFEKQFTNTTVNAIGRHGKYFWLRNNHNQCLLMHFGMTGWIQVKDIETHFIVMENGGDKTVKERFKDAAAQQAMAEMEIKHVKTEVWPPRFYKFVMTMDDDTQVAFIDGRRLGKLRSIEASNDADLMAIDPLSKLGLDFSMPKDRWDLDTFSQRVAKRKMPIKSLLMDQAVFSGIGNWVADEICYQAKLHPEELASQLTSDQLELLYNRLIEICEFVVKVEGNTAAFPKHWLMLYRWGKKRKNEESKTADGYVIDHITVGGRTAAYVPAIQVKSAGSPSKAVVKNKRKAAASPSTKVKKVKKEKKAESESESETEVKPRTTRSGRVSKRLL